MPSSKSFARSLSDAQMQALCKATNDPNHWWRDLLSLWRPSGHASGTDGLRLAIRKGYLNFYRRGQSVARVGFDAGGQLTLSVHAKYVVSDEERQLPKLSYARLIDHHLVHAGLSPKRYEGVSSLRAWVKVIDEHFTVAGGEKPLIDELLGVRENSNVIDLEMALPAWEQSAVAPRMDVVTVEDVHGRLTVVFGEVKRVDDGRIRCSGPHIANEYPKVRRQLADYRTYLAEETHRASIAAAYAHTASRLTELNAMAAEVRGQLSIGSPIERAAEGEPLSVAREAALVVLCVGRFSQRAWEIHRERLRAGDQSIRLVELEGAAAMNLGALV